MNEEYIEKLRAMLANKDAIIASQAEELRKLVAENDALRVHVASLTEDDHK